MIHPAYDTVPNFRPMKPGNRPRLTTKRLPQHPPELPAAAEPAPTIVKPFSAVASADHPEVSNNTGRAGLVASQTSTPTKARAVAEPTPKPLDPVKTASVRGNDREDMERALKVIYTWSGIDGALVPAHVRELAGRVLGLV